MSKSLITLTESEQYLQDANFKMTLKDVADKYGKKHSNLIRDFYIDISQLDDDELLALHFEQSIFEAKSGKGKIDKYKTLSLDFKTLIWFIARFDSKLRLQIINFAFEKYQEEQNNKLLEIKSMAEKVRLHEDGTTSITGLIQHYGFEEDYQTIKDALTWKGVMDIELKITTRPKMNDNYNGIVFLHKKYQKDNTKTTTDVSYFKEPVKTIVEQYKKAGMPNVNDNFKDRARKQLEEYLSKF